jgi:hypothetical protein
MNTNSEQNGKVLKFPVQNANASGSEYQSQTTGARALQRLGVGTGLVLIFSVATLLNGYFMNPIKMESSSKGRSLASVSQRGMPQNIEWEHELAENLAKGAHRGIASLGRTPSSEDDLRYGVLGGGKYVFRFDTGKIQAIEFLGASHVKREPQYVTDRQAFLNKYRALLPGDFEAIVPAETKEDNQKSVEIFELLKDGTKVGSVEFTLDQHGRLLSLKAE